jgi:hypothetical protein
MKDHGLKTTDHGLHATGGSLVLLARSLFNSILVRTSLGAERSVVGGPWSVVL